MTTETQPSNKSMIAKKIAKLVVLNSVSATVSTVVYQNVTVEKKVAKVQLAIGAYALGSAAADRCWEAVYNDINQIVKAFKDAKREKEEEAVVITDVE